MLVRLPTLSILIVFVVVFAISCSDDDDPVQPGDPYQAIIDQFGLEPLGSIPYPEDNPHNPQRIALGQLLFFDPILGGESAPWVKSAAGKDPYRFRANDVACATCHHPTLGFADGRNMGAGVGGAQYNDMDLGPHRVVPGPSLVNGTPVGVEPRNSPTCLNVGFNGQNSPEPVADGFQFLDGRSKGLEQQAENPIVSRDEMAGDAYGRLTEEDEKPAFRDSVVKRLRNIPEYYERFKQAFPQTISSPEDISLESLTFALAAYQRELVTPDSRYDRFVSGDRNALNEFEKKGFELFFDKGLCGDCHSGPMLSDFTFRVQGVGDGYEVIDYPFFRGKNNAGTDWGRFHAGPEFADQKFAFRTMTIRNVEITGPYFHSGSAGTLREAVEFYNRGGLGEQDISDETLELAGAVRDPSIRPLGLTYDEIEAIVAFMKTTTAPVAPGPSGMDLTEVPQRVPSGLLPPGIPTPNKPGPYYPEDGGIQ